MVEEEEGTEVAAHGTSGGWMMGEQVGDGSWASKVAGAQSKKPSPREMGLAPASGCTAFVTVPVVCATLRPPANFCQPSGLGTRFSEA
jgi:hypothetical protein